jgi:hypothetical protein
VGGYPPRARDRVPPPSGIRDLDSSLPSEKLDAASVPALEYGGVDPPSGPGRQGGGGYPHEQAGGGGRVPPRAVDRVPPPSGIRDRDSSVPSEKSYAGSVPALKQRGGGPPLWPEQAGGVGVPPGTNGGEGVGYPPGTGRGTDPRMPSCGMRGSAVVSRTHPPYPDVRSSVPADSHDYPPSASIRV